MWGDIIRVRAASGRIRCTWCDSARRRFCLFIRFVGSPSASLRAGSRRAFGSVRDDISNFLEGVFFLHAFTERGLNHFTYSPLWTSYSTRKDFCAVRSCQPFCAMSSWACARRSEGMGWERK